MIHIKYVEDNRTKIPNFRMNVEHQIFITSAHEIFSIDVPHGVVESYEH